MLAVQRWNLLLRCLLVVAAFAWAILTFFVVAGPPPGERPVAVALSGAASLLYLIAEPELRGSPSRRIRVQHAVPRLLLVYLFQTFVNTVVAWGLVVEQPAPAPPRGAPAAAGGRSGNFRRPHTKPGAAAAATVGSQHMAHRRSEGARARRSIEDRHGFNASSLSVIVPCAMEGGYAARTAESILRHTEARLLKELIVVDDGSLPPLRVSSQVKDPRLRELRSETREGLIKTKSKGAAVATGDVLVFLDCHVKPRPGWERGLLKEMDGDYRRVVVPIITALNYRNWEEDASREARSYYLLLNGDFSVMEDGGMPQGMHDVPIMSGGLLAITRRWWVEVGGYDDEMLIWGGENVDLSLRTWLCGGEVRLATESFVAHMWRNPQDKGTKLNYELPEDIMIRNRMRAVLAHYDAAFLRKAYTYPELAPYGPGGTKSAGDISPILDIKQRLGCDPFVSFFHKFSWLYLDGGFFPPEVFMLREQATGLCLELQATLDCERSSCRQELRPCDGAGSGAVGANDMQLFHASNARGPGECCSGMRHWDTTQCLQASPLGQWSVRQGDPATFAPCAWQGQKPTQQVALGTDGKLRWGHSGAFNGAEEVCANVGEVAAVESVGAPPPEGACAKAERRGASLLLTSADSNGGHLCVAPSEGWEKPVRFRHADECTGRDGALHVVRTPTGSWLVRDPRKDVCLDAGGGSNLIWYYCYPKENKNLNQAFEIENGRLVWGDSCVGTGEVGQKVGFRTLPSEPRVELRPCVQTDEYQRWEISGVADPAPASSGRSPLPGWDHGRAVSIREAQPGGKCAEVRGNSIVLRSCCEDCGDRQLWQTHRNASNDAMRLVHLGSNACLDANDMLRVIMYPCQLTLNKKQEFVVREVEAPSTERHAGRRPARDSTVALPRTFVDQGRTRFASLCLTAPGRPRHHMVIGPCRGAARWQKLGSFEPPETRAYRDASKTWSET